MKTIILFASILLSFLVNAQKNEKLRVGEKIPFSRIVVLNQDKKATNIDLPNGKTSVDRFVLVYFYSSEKTTKELIAFNNFVLADFIVVFIKIPEAALCPPPPQRAAILLKS